MSKPDGKDFVNRASYSARRGAIEVDDFEPARDIELLSDHVLVDREIAAEKTEGGIYIPEVAREPKFTGTLVAAGPDCSETVKLSLGKRVMHGKYSGIEMALGAKIYCLVRESDIVAFLSLNTKATRID